MDEQLMIIPEDLQYLAEESGRNLNLILAEMTALMEENTDKVSYLENQNWFQRMSRTISGKNKMTQEEIAQNHDKINLYLSQTISELYNRNHIDHEVILGLGNKINELYESQVEIKIMIGAFVQKLNKKIESIDNYHMLIEEINQGIFDDRDKFCSIGKIMSQLDLRTVRDTRKMDILKRALEERHILERQEIEFSVMLENLISLSENEAGILALFFGNIRNEYIAQIAEEVIYTYYSLPQKIRKMKSRHSLVENILNANDIDLNYSVSYYDICDTLMEAYAENIVEAAIEEQKSEEENKKISIRKYFTDAAKFLELLRDMVDSWGAKDDDLNTHKSRAKYAGFMTKLIDNLDTSSYIGNSILNDLNNITFLLQNIFAKYKEFRVHKTDSIIFKTKEQEKQWIEAGFELEYVRVNANLALEIDKEESRYQTIIEYYKEFLHNMFDNNETGWTRQLYSLQTMDSICAEFPDPSNYTNFFFFYTYMEVYVNLYCISFEKILKKAETDISFLSELHNLCQRFPINYDSDINGDDYFKALYRDCKRSASVPYIELQCRDSVSIGYMNLVTELESYETRIIQVRLRNIKRKNYTIRMNIIENEYIDMSNWESYKYVDIEWGEWIEENVVELKITKNTDSSLGTLKMKLYIAEDPDIVAYIIA